MGLMLGLDALVSRAFGAGRPRGLPSLARARRWRWRCCVVAAVHAGPVRAWPVCSGDGVCTPTVLELTRPYLDAVTWSLPPLLLYSAFRRYLQGMGVVRPIMVALVTANIVNAVVQLDPDLRAPRRAGDGGSRIRVGDRRSRAA